MTVPTTADVGRLPKAADGPFRAFIGLCAFAGLRLGEGAGVQVGDVDFLRRTLTVSRQIQRENGGFDVRLPKWGSERTVYLAPALVKMLAEHVRLYRPGDDGQRWLFTGEGQGRPPHQNTIGARWRATLARAGIEGLKLHDLRHFYASGLISQGCDVVTVQRALGHATATTTLSTYAHLWPTAEDRTRAAAESMLSEALAVPADSSRTTGVR
jgi:integrase